MKIRALFLLMLLTPSAWGKPRYDPDYIFKPSNSWTIKTRTDVGRESLQLSAETGDSRYRLDFEGGTKLRQRIGFGYGGLILGFGINLSGRKVGWDTSLKMLGNQSGLELNLSGLKAAGGSLRVEDAGIALNANLPPGSFNQTSLAARGYYAFNGRKFSMPAVLTQRFRQQKSAGSALLTTALSALWLNRKTGDDETLPLSRQFIGFAGAGLGYGYNWVPGRKWLLHLSAIENVGIPWERYTLKNTPHKGPLRGPGFLTTGRAGVFFYPGNWYFGLSAYTEYYIAPDFGSGFNVRTFELQGQISVGVHFGA